MRPQFAALTIALAALLAGCGVVGVAGARLRADISPTQLGFEIDDEGTIVIVANNVSFRNAPSAAEATITGYEVRYFADNGQELIGANSELVNHHLAIQVPAGYVCATGEDVAFCDLGNRIPTTRFSEPQPFIMVHGQIAIAIVNNNLPRVRAVITFFADQGMLRVEWSEEITITYPVAGE